LRERYGRAGQARVENHFSIQVAIQNTQDLYVQLLADKGGRI
jgi:hypothetical protein